MAKNASASSLAARLCALRIAYSCSRALSRAAPLLRATHRTSHHLSMATSSRSPLISCSRLKLLAFCNASPSREKGQRDLGRARRIYLPSSFCAILSLLRLFLPVAALPYLCSHMEYNMYHIAGIYLCNSHYPIGRGDPHFTFCSSSYII